MKIRVVLVILMLALVFCVFRYGRSPSLAGYLPTQKLTAQHYEIYPEDLPEPYASESVSKPPKVVAESDSRSLNVPDGFRVNVFAFGLDQPRWLKLTPDGDVLVAESHSHRIKRLIDYNHDGEVDRVALFASIINGLSYPHGMDFSGNYFFVGNTGDVRRYNYPKGQKELEDEGQVIAVLPHEANHHWTRSVIVSPDQWLYVSVGSASNNDEEALPRASIQRMHLDGSDATIFASGMRNPLGLAIHPKTGQLYASVNERDGLGDDLVPDYITQVKEGAFYGWPYAYFTPALLDPRYVKGGKSVAPKQVEKTVLPDVLLQAHSAVMAIQFGNRTNFPAHYKNGLFAALRGSWNRDKGTGYKIIHIPFDESGRPAGGYDDFVTGFLVEPSGPVTWGRPVGMEILNDGSLIFCDEANGRIFRVSYIGD